MIGKSSEVLILPWPKWGSCSSMDSF